MIASDTYFQPSLPPSFVPGRAPVQAGVRQSCRTPDRAKQSPEQCCRTTDCGCRPEVAFRHVPDASGFAAIPRLWRHRYTASRAGIFPRTPSTATPPARQCCRQLFPDSRNRPRRQSPVRKRSTPPEILCAMSVPNGIFPAHEPPQSAGCPPAMLRQPSRSMPSAVKLRPSAGPETPVFPEKPSSAGRRKHPRFLPGIPDNRGTGKSRPKPDIAQTSRNPGEYSPDCRANWQSISGIPAAPPAVPAQSAMPDCDSAHNCQE
ncbi:hypothetical protein SDC9_119648 [bioreactor metagenome]|uniref:Uncharacterized protein n=1 Tax=bioreactor metagenome TaxID=1076179 RepID=A0A645C4V0_9ZZZZ